MNMHCNKFSVNPNKRTHINKAKKRNHDFIKNSNTRFYVMRTKQQLCAKKSQNNKTKTQILIRQTCQVYTVHDRNQFITDHYDLLKRICRYQARLVKTKYPRVNFADLEAYGFEGIIAAIHHLNTMQKGWYTYLSKYAYHYAIKGAHQMLGIPRVRTKKNNAECVGKMILLPPEDIARHVESYAFFSENYIFNELPFGFYEFIHYELLNLVKFLGQSVERMVLCGIICHLNIKGIARRYELEPRRVRKAIDDLKCIYRTDRLKRTPTGYPKLRVTLHYYMSEFKRLKKFHYIIVPGHTSCKKFIYSKPKPRKDYRKLGAKETLRIIRRAGIYY